MDERSFQDGLALGAPESIECHHYVGGRGYRVAEGKASCPLGDEAQQRRQDRSTHNGHHNQRAAQLRIRPSPFTPSAKIVGNMIDMKKLVVRMAIAPIAPGCRMPTLSNKILMTA